MMSDHWKAIARLLGAAGATEAPTPAPQTPETAGSEPEKAIPSVEAGDRSTQGRHAKVRDTAESIDEAIEVTKAKSPKVKPNASAESYGASSFGAGLVSEEAPAERVVRASRKADSGKAEPSPEPADDVLNFSSFSDLDDDREKPARDLFGKSSQAGKMGRNEPKSQDNQSEENPEPKGLDRLFGETESSSEPSSWDKLVDRLGVDQPEDRNQARRTIEEPAKRPSESDAEKRLNAGSAGGFGAGLGLDLDEDDEEPFKPKEERASKNRPGSRSAPKKHDAGEQRTIDSKSERGETVSEESLDPLSEIGGEGWGRPRRKSRSADADDVQGGRGFGDLLADDGADESPSTEDPKAEAGGDERFSRAGRRDARGGRRDQGNSEQREQRSDRDRKERNNGEGGRQDRLSASRQASVELRGDDETKNAERGEATEEGEATRGPKRGRRRGQRQRMGDELQDGRDDFGKRKAATGAVDELFDFADGSDDPLDGSQSSSGLDDTDDNELESDSPNRRRRRRGRRRKGQGSDATDGVEQSVRTPADEAVKSSGRAIDAEFDDDHEDDEEAVVLRRSRRRRRRRGGDLSEAKGPLDSDDVGPVGSVAYDPVDDDEDAVTYNTQRNVPTWLEAVDILVNTNLDTRKRDPKRSSSGGNGNGGGGRQRPRR